MGGREAQTIDEGEFDALTPAYGTRTAFGRYELVRDARLGVLGPRAVARDLAEDGKLVVLEVLAPHRATDPLFVRAVEEAFEAARHIHHRNVVGWTSVARRGSVVASVRQYVDGVDGDLLTQACVHRRTPVPWPVAARIVSDLARGVQAVQEARDKSGYARDLVHGQLAPHGFLIGRDGWTRLVDPVLPRLAGRPLQDPRSVPYRAPEQLEESPIDARTDVHAIGVIAWELCVGRPLFRGADARGTREALDAHDVPRIDEVVPRVPETIARVIARATKHFAGERWPSACAFANALDEALRLADADMTPAAVSQWIGQWFPVPSGPVAAGHGAPVDDSDPAVDEVLDVLRGSVSELKVTARLPDYESEDLAQTRHADRPAPEDVPAAAASGWDLEDMFAIKPEDEEVTRARLRIVDVRPPLDTAADAPAARRARGPGEGKGGQAHCSSPIVRTARPQRGSETRQVAMVVGAIAFVTLLALIAPLVVARQSRSVEKGDLADPNGLSPARGRGAQGHTPTQGIAKAPSGPAIAADRGSHPPSARSSRSARPQTAASTRHDVAVDIAIADDGALPGTSAAPISIDALSNDAPRQPGVASKQGDGSLSIVCLPACAVVEVDGARVGPSPIIERPMARGWHTLRVYDRGELLVEREISVDSDRDTVVKIRQGSAGAARR